MAKFNHNLTEFYGSFSAENDSNTFTVDELLEVLRPAALKLKDYYQKTIRRLFKQHTGSLADSIDIEDDYVSREYAFITVKPFGTHKSGSRTRKSRAGAADRKYAKHGRQTSAKKLKNEELAYLLEHGTPRIAATHWMENTNEEVESEIQDMIDAEFGKLLQKKGLL